MVLEAIEHRADSSYAHALDEQTIVIRLRAKKGDLKQCVLFYGDRAYPKNPVVMDSVEMECVASDRLFDYFEVELQSEYTRVCYYFWLSDGISSIFYYGNEFHETTECERFEFFQFPYLRREDIADVPAWAKESVIYQIFPDSFATTKRAISQKEKCVVHTDGETCRSKKGGTIRGIIENLDYIERLGVNCIYINPIFAAGEYHKYDTIDYYSIDPCFGDNETFKELVKQCHARNIRVIIDGVFNHCGWKFFAFKDLIEKGEESKYKDWFYDVNFPIRCTDQPNYACFAYEKKMPKLNTGNPEVMDYLISVGTYWIKEYDIDGWRLDVANEVDHHFWRCFRRAVKAVKPDAFLIAEIWEDSQMWLLGDQFDSTMNYRFANICKLFFAEKKISVDDFDGRIQAMRMRYKKNIAYAQMNLLDSHDTPRFMSACSGDVRRLKLAALFLMMGQGIPSIYSGDEKGFDGKEEEEYRQPMKWEDDEFSWEITEYYRRLVALRKRCMPQMLGEYRTLLKDSAKSVYAFERIGKNGGKIIVVINNSEFLRNVEIPVNTDKTNVKDVLGNRSYKVSDGVVEIQLDAVSGAILEIV